MANATSTYASGQRSIARKRKERRQLLDHMERVTGLNRKTLIRHMNGKVHRKPRRKQRANTYGREVDDALRVISQTLDYISAQCLIPHLVTMAQDLIMHGQLELSAGLPENLGRISAATVRRRLKKFAQLEQWRLPQRQGPRQRSTVTRSTSKGRTPQKHHALVTSGAPRAVPIPAEWSEGRKSRGSGYGTPRCQGVLSPEPLTKEETLRNGHSSLEPRSQPLQNPLATSLRRLCAVGVLQ